MGTFLTKAPDPPRSLAKRSDPHLIFHEDGLSIGLSSFMIYLTSPGSTLLIFLGGSVSLGSMESLETSLRV